MSSFRNNLLTEVLKLDFVKNLKVSVSSSIKYGSIVGAAAIVSGILGGPRGLAIGGAIGSCLAGYMADGSFKSVPYILLYETTPEQRKRLSDALFKLVNKKNIKDFAQFMLAIRNDGALMILILNIIKAFLSNEMNYQCV